MKLAVGLTPLETRRDVVLHVADRAEALGYDAFFVAEGWGHDASVLLAEVALRTSRIQIGTGVLNIWGRSPAQIAMLAATLQEISGGRFVLGLGAGSPALAEGLHDIAFRAPVARLAAVTRQVRALLQGGRMSPAGGGRGLRLALGPSHIPIMLAALGPAAIRVAGALSDSWGPFFLPVSALPDGIRLLRDAATGRTAPAVCPAIPAAVSPDPERAAALASWWIDFYLTKMGPLYANRLRQLGLGLAVDQVLSGADGTPDRLRDELTLCGDGSARAGIDRWYAAGADRPAITLPPDCSVEELDYMLEAFAPLAAPVRNDRAQPVPAPR
ncbi:Flavin-dependent oxidoreductase, luciferase family (includes alkanesulfonate monooxygenase SsuD and methylene tetrahydromethanopterin reductase) [Nakamurella panacisegetis]|uniref:Flavin-dependent oxidoreductase, luciferase family (Includes alkanesulfonate monooxygenase SsuD and methylene tetrahydromethanopterin reductase) n=1 Tax=Nakamurella panacisegetis TaxID=1090615 RepID=A0A1H0LNX9_9ACTN|nr:LLM class flavin-dependent oxidoreductase [Nakamurella panacisegetis]SDO69753.1 Flavin-dependent oxidoreductase, luciferase family (includes alkanesulfonate monooxygenase SsuD and methylene tetrahydromethanopterin reductase) [Nakamurella panacisegetis]